MAINFNFTAAPVTQFAKTSPQGDAAALGQVTDATVNVIKEGKRLYDESQVNKAATYFEELQSFDSKAKHVRLYYGGQELEGTDFPGQRFETTPDGEEMPMQIPAWQAEPYIRKRDSMNNLESAASGIGDYFIRQKMLTRGQKQIQDAFQQDIETSLEVGKQQMRWETAEELQVLQEQGNFAGSLDLIENSSVFTDAEKAKMSLETRKESEVYDVREILLVPEWGPEQFEAAEQMIEYLDMDEVDNYPGPLDQEKRLELIAALQREMRTRTAGGSTKATDEQVRYEMFLLRNIKSDLPEADITESTLWNDKQNNLLTINQYKSLTKASITRDVELETKILELKRYQDFLKQGGKPPPTPEFQKKTNDLYDFLLNEYDKSLNGAERKPFEVMNIGLRVSKTSGMVPQGVQDQWMSANAGSIKQLETGAQLYNLYVDTVPEAMRTVNSDDIGTLTDVAARLELGIDPAVALEGALKARDANENEKNVWKDAWKNYVKPDANGTAGSKMFNEFVGFLESDEYYNYGGWFSGLDDAPAFGAEQIAGVPADAVESYKQLVKAHFERTGSLGSARLQAQRDFKKTYTLTNINNPEDEPNQLIAYFPAIDEFGVKQIRESVEEQYRDQLESGEKLYLYSDATTLRTGAQNRNGALFSVVAVDEDGTPRRLEPWKLDPRIKQDVKVSSTRTLIEALYRKKAHLDKMAFYRGDNAAFDEVRQEINNQIREKEELLQSYGE